MAKTNENMDHNENLSAAEAWARAAANCKYGVRSNGVPYGGAEGFVVDLPCPGDWFANVPVPQQRTEFQARAEYMLNRIAQPEAKKADATRDTVQEAVNKASLNGYEPTRTRDKDPVEAEVERRFAALVRGKVLEQKPDARDDQIALKTEQMAETPQGKAKLAEFREAILTAGTYAVQRKTRKGAVADLGIGELNL